MIMKYCMGWLGVHILKCVNLWILSFRHAHHLGESPLSPPRGRGYWDDFRKFWISRVLLSSFFLSVTGASSKTIKTGLVCGGGRVYFAIMLKPEDTFLRAKLSYDWLMLWCRYPVDYGLPGRVQVNPLSTLEEEDDEYPTTPLHPSIQALDVLQHRGTVTIRQYKYHSTPLHPSIQALDVIQHRGSYKSRTMSTPSPPSTPPSRPRIYCTPAQR